jgi:hypothetical protein
VALVLFGGSTVKKLGFEALAAFEKAGLRIKSKEMKNGS